MGLLDNFEPTTYRQPCRVRAVIESLDKNDQQILVAALADRNKWPNLTLSKALIQRGIDLKDKTISNHRNGGCSC